MKHFSFIITIVLFCTAALGAANIYVSAEANTNNAANSWMTATTFQHALSLARSGDNVWLKQGTYFTSTTDRAASFVIPAGVQVYGGFLGTETSVNQRPFGGASILSGDIGRQGDLADNAYTVVVMQSNGFQPSTLDGFVLTGGNARNFKEGYSPNSAGGALFIEASRNGLSNHQVINCIFQNNQAHNGGAVYVNSGRPAFEGCTFANNSADFNGGAIYNQGAGNEASPIFRDCTFDNNNSNYGAGMTNNGINGASRPLLIDCHFDNNVSVTTGSAIYNITKGQGICEVVMEGCSFQGNASILDADVSGDGISASIADKARQNSGGILRPVSAKK